MAKKKEFPWTQKQIDKRVTEYVCYDCGHHFLNQSTCPADGVLSVSTFHTGICGLCKTEQSVTHVRAYNHLKIPK